MIGSRFAITGLIRLVATHGVRYQLAVGEYGQHWNFFFTLAVVKMMTAVVSVPQHLALPAGVHAAEMIRWHGVSILNTGTQQYGDDLGVHANASSTSTC